MNWLSIADAIERAEGASREVDRMVGQTAWPGVALQWPDCWKAPAAHWNKKPLPWFTSSLDAVADLIAEKLPGWVWRLDSNSSCQDGPAAYVWGPIEYGKPGSAAATPALALLAAFCRAMAARDGQEGGR